MENQILNNEVKPLDMVVNNDIDRQLVERIRKEIKIFSIEKQFDVEKSKSYTDGINAVTVITPTQTISRFNDDIKNGLIGSGYHSDNFDEITQAVYGMVFPNYNALGNGQDIMIKYVNDYYQKMNEQLMQMVVYIPQTINSSQAISLQSLNDEIKQFQKNHNLVIDIYVQFIGKERYSFQKFNNGLDEIMNCLPIDDMSEIKYHEKNLIGIPNYSYDKSLSNDKLSSKS